MTKLGGRIALILPAFALVVFTAGTARVPAAYEVAADTTTVTIRSTSAALAFDPEVVTVPAGKPVKVRYINDSALSHNIVILKNENDLDAIGAASFDAHDTGFVPAQFKSKMVAWSPLAEAGKTVTFTFVAPPAGDFTFACFVDGHFNMMIGKMRSIKTVEKD